MYIIIRCAILNEALQFVIKKHYFILKFARTGVKYFVVYNVM